MTTKDVVDAILIFTFVVGSAFNVPETVYFWFKDKTEPNIYVEYTRYIVVILTLFNCAALVSISIGFPDTYTLQNWVKLLKFIIHGSAYGFELIEFFFTAVMCSYRCLQIKNPFYFVNLKQVKVSVVLVSCVLFVSTVALVGIRSNFSGFDPNVLIVYVSFLGLCTAVSLFSNIYLAWNLLSDDEQQNQSRDVRRRATVMILAFSLLFVFLCTALPIYIGLYFMHLVEKTEKYMFQELAYKVAAVPLSVYHVMVPVYLFVKRNDLRQWIYSIFGYGHGKAEIVSNNNFGVSSRNDIASTSA